MEERTGGRVWNPHLHGRFAGAVRPSQALPSAYQDSTCLKLDERRVIRADGTGDHVDGLVGLVSSVWVVG